MYKKAVGGQAINFIAVLDSRASRTWGFIDLICKKVAWPRSLQKIDYFTRDLVCTPPIYDISLSCMHSSIPFRSSSSRSRSRSTGTGR